MIQGAWELRYYPNSGQILQRSEMTLCANSDRRTAANMRPISFAWLKRTLDKKEGDCKTALAPEKRRKR